MVENFNNNVEIFKSKIDTETIILLIKIIVVIIISKYGNLNEYTQILNLAFSCLSMVIGSNLVKKLWCC